MAINGDRIMSARAQIKIEGFLRWAEQEPGRVTEIRSFFQYRGGHLVVQEMRRQAPKRTGFLRTTIGWDPTPSGFIVSPGASYAPIVIRGIKKKYPIFARFAKALAFEWKGKMRFFKKVMHPKTRGVPFVSRTIDIVKPKLYELARRKWRELHER